jgi:hypothetical protein
MRYAGRNLINSALRLLTLYYILDPQRRIPLTLYALYSPIRSLTSEYSRVYSYGLAEAGKVLLTDRVSCYSGKTQRTAKHSCR